MADPQREHRTPADWPFFLSLSILGGAYLLLIAAMLMADASFTTPFRIWQALGSPAIRYAIWLSLISCSISAILSVWVAVPLSYLLSRFDFPGRKLIDVLIDIPIVLPPLVVGLSLLILFQTPPGRLINSVIPVTYAIPSVVLAQFSVACAFAVRTMRGTFDQIPRRREQVAMTLGCSRGQAFWRVTLPEARRGVVAAFTSGRSCSFPELRGSARRCFRRRCS
jgi:molybdate transport system permease protein